VCTVVESTVVEQPTAALGYLSEGLESPIRVATFGTYGNVQSRYDGMEPKEGQDCDKMEWESRESEKKRKEE
jgi:hypothetical protein